MYAIRFGAGQEWASIFAFCWRILSTAGPGLIHFHIADSGKVGQVVKALARKSTKHLF